MAELPVLSGSTPKFLMTSEKVSRWVVGAGMGLLAAVGIYRALPYVIRFAEMGIEAGFKMLVLGGMLALIGGILTIVLNPTFQASVWYMLVGWVDAIALNIVKINPIARVKSYVSHYLEPMMVRSQEVLDRAVAREKSAEKRVEETTQSLKQAEARAEYCLSHGSSNAGRTWNDQKLHNEFSLQSAKIRTLRDALLRLNKRLAFQRGCVKVLQDLQGVISAYIEVTRFNVSMMVQEYESASEMADGTHDVQGMLGNSEKTKLFNMAAQNIQDQTNQWMAEVEGVMKIVQTQINTGKIDDAIGEEGLIRELTDRVGNMSTFAEGQRQLAEGGDAVLFSTAKSKVLEGELVEVKPREIASGSGSRFQKLLPPK